MSYCFFTVKAAAANAGADFSYSSYVNIKGIDIVDVLLLLQKEQKQ